MTRPNRFLGPASRRGSVEAELVRRDLPPGIARLVRKMKFHRDPVSLRIFGFLDGTEVMRVKEEDVDRIGLAAAIAEHCRGRYCFGCGQALVDGDTCAKCKDKILTDIAKVIRRSE